MDTITITQDLMMVGQASGFQPEVNAAVFNFALGSGFILFGVGSRKHASGKGGKSS